MNLGDESQRKRKKKKLNGFLRFKKKPFNLRLSPLKVLLTFLILLNLIMKWMTMTMKQKAFLGQFFSWHVLFVIVYSLIGLASGDKEEELVSKDATPHVSSARSG
jgi:hypothetical protein